MNLRRLLWLGFAALVAITGAFWLSTQRGLPRAIEAGAPVLPELEARLDAVTEIRIERGDGTRTTLRRTAAGWRVLERDFPAATGPIRKLLLDLAALKIVEEKTSDPKRYAQLQVDDVTGPAARGTLITLFVDGKADQALALIVGKADGARHVFVRVPGAATSLLAAPPISTEAEPRRWLETALLDIKAERVRRVTVTPATGAAYILERPTDAKAPLALSALPPGREVADPAAIDAIAATLADLRIEDVQAAGAGASASLPSGAEARFETGDGLTLDLRERRSGERSWYTLEASGSSQASRAEAERINAQVRGRDFELPAWKASGLLRPLEELLKTR